MVGLPSAWVGFFVHMVISATIGGSFAVLLNASGLRGGVASGLVYSFAWWILGPLSLMGQAMPSLMGHLIFGVILGVTYRWLHNRAPEPSVRSGRAQAA